MTNAVEAVQAALRGDFTLLVEIRDQPGGVSGALEVAADALCYLAGIDDAPSACVVSRGEDGALAARLLGLSAALRGDVSALEALHALGDHTLAGAWLDGSPDALAEIERHAASVGDAALVLEAAALRALVLSRRGELAAALGHARRASRMARTEAMPQQEYLANLVLARVRRLSGQPYLAARILAALRGFAPRPWHRWIDWELVMATGRASPDAEAVTSAVTSLLAGGEGADATAWPLFDEDLSRLRAAMGLPAPHDDEIAGWCSGAFAKPPFGLSGAVTVAGDDDTIARVLAQPGERARRMLVAGRAHVASHVAELPGASRAFARTDAILASLMLSNEPMPIEDVFRMVWGFKFSPSVHRAVFDTALHRARARLGDHGTIERDNDVLSLLLHEALVVPDPRCVSPPEERVLLYVASHAAASAQEASRALDIPLRSVQTFLKALVADGACRREKVGRRVAYIVEDTTFREPTGHHRAPG